MVCWWRGSLVHGTMLFTLPNVNDFHDDKVHQPLIYPGNKLAVLGTLLGVLAAITCLQSPGNRNLDMPDLGTEVQPISPEFRFPPLRSSCCIGLSWAEGGRLSEVLHFLPFSVLKSEWLRSLYLDFWRTWNLVMQFCDWLKTVWLWEAPPRGTSSSCLGVPLVSNNSVIVNCIWKQNLLIPLKAILFFLSLLLIFYMIQAFIMGHCFPERLEGKVWSGQRESNDQCLIFIRNHRMFTFPVPPKNWP